MTVVEPIGEEGCNGSRHSFALGANRPCQCGKFANLLALHAAQNWDDEDDRREVDMKCVCGHPQEFHDPKRLQEVSSLIHHGPNCVGGHCGCSGFWVDPITAEEAALVRRVLATTGGAPMHERQEARRIVDRFLPSMPDTGRGRGLPLAFGDAANC